MGLGSDWFSMNHSIRGGGGKHSRFMSCPHTADSDTLTLTSREQLTKSTRYSVPLQHCGTDLFNNCQLFSSEELAVLWMLMTIHKLRSNMLCFFNKEETSRIFVWPWDFKGILCEVPFSTLPLSYSVAAMASCNYVPQIMFNNVFNLRKTEKRKTKNSDFLPQMMKIFYSFVIRQAQ